MDASIDRRTAILTSAALIAAAGPTRAATRTPHANGFGFLHGRWNVTHHKLRRRLVGDREWFAFPGTLEVAPILGGLGNFDRNILHDPAGRYEASSLRLYDPKAHRWSIWWFDSRATGSIDPPVVGGFDGITGTFYADDRFEGRAIRVRTTYRPIAPGRAEWTQAFSSDGGATWEVNWIMEFHRA